MQHPEFLGPYRIIRPLGRGGMGTVYEAVVEETGEPVAVKLIAASVADEVRFQDRFKTEVRALHRLRHKGIVRLLHSHIDEAGRIYYSMELVDGESLHERLRREKKIDWMDAIEISIQVCEALKHAHDAGVTHRDLKPANLMLTPDGKVKLVDFGIAKLFGDSSQTHIGSVLGTADYMAPEQTDSSSATPRTDLYALGNVMYAMLVGRPPFSGKRVTEVINSLKRERPAPLDLIDPYLPEELVELVHHLLEKDPTRRPPTALSVLKRLRSMKIGLERRRKTLESEGKATENRDPGPPPETMISQRPVSDYDDDTKPVPLHELTEDSDVDSSIGSSADPSRRTVEVRGSDGTIKTMSSTGAVGRRSGPMTDFHLEDDYAANASPRDETDSHDWKHWATIAAMVLALLGGTILFVYAIRPPDADSLYATASSGELDAMQTFLRRFPDDPRREEIYRQLMDRRLQAVNRRLQTQANLGISPLSAAEESFLAATENRYENPQQAIQRLQQWLQLYDKPASDADLASEELIELANFQLAELRRISDEQIMDPRARELLDDIDKIITEEKPEVAVQRLEALIETFAESDFAKPAIDQAREQISRLEEK